MKVILKMLVGAVCGFLAMYLVLGMELNISIDLNTFVMTTILFVVSGVLLFISLLGTIQIRSKAKLQFVGDEEDDMDDWKNKRFTDLTLTVNIASFLSLLSLAFAAITEQSLPLVFGSLALVLISTFFSISMADLMRVVSPNRNLPAVNEKDYIQKSLEATDEGERHIMLQGLYKTYININNLLLFAVLLLILYSLISNSSQLVSITILIVILIISNSQYLLTIRNK